MAEVLATELFQGKVTHVIDPFNFWAHIGTETDIYNFDCLTNDLNQFCKSVGVFSNDDDCGELDRSDYILVYQYDKWVRAQVARVDCNKQTVDVLYLDTGNTDMVHVNQICVACPNIFYKLNPQAVKCRIAGIVPLARNWNSRSIKYFKELTKEKVFQTVIVNVDPHFSYHEVSLYNSDEEGRSIAHFLMEEEMALPNDVEVPEFAKDVKSALPYSYIASLIYDTDDQSTIYSDTCSPVSHTTSSTDHSNQPSCTSSPTDQLFTSTDDTSITTSNSVISISSVGGDKNCAITGKDVKKILDSSNNSFHEQCVTPPLCQNNETKQSSSSPAISIKEIPTPQKIYTDAWSCPEPQTPASPEPPSSEIAIPSFDLTAIKETKTVCPEQLQEEKNKKRRLTTKCAIKENIGKIHDEMEYQDNCVPVEWDLSDLHIARPQNSNHDVYDNIKSQIDSLQSTPQYQRTDENFVNGVKKQSKNVDIKNHSIPQKFHRTPEDGKSQICLKTNIETVLRDIAKEDPVIICEKLHQLVPAENFCDERTMSVCLENILSQSVKHKIYQDALLKILDTYSACDIFGQCMESVIMKLSSVYVKRPVHKAIHLDFAHLLVELLCMSEYWTKRVATQMKNLTSNLVEKWIIFNKLGQGGKGMDEISELHLGCLEILWPKLITELSDARYKHMLEEIQEKLLQDKITRTTRKRLFNMYITKRGERRGIDVACNTDATTETYVSEAQLKSDSTTQTIPVQYSTQSSQTDIIEDGVLTEIENSHEDQQEKNVEVDSDISNYMFGDDDDDDEYDVQEPSISNCINISDSYTAQTSEKNMSKNKQTSLTNFSVIRRTEGSASDGYSSSSSISSHRQSTEKKIEINDICDVKSSDAANVSVNLARDTKILDIDFRPKKLANHDRVKAKKSQGSDKKNYNSWAACVKKEKNEAADAISLQEDHLKHLAIQTLKSGILKGKNIQARRQLSTEDLRLNSKSSMLKERDFPTLSKNSSDQPSRTSSRQNKSLPLKKSPKSDTNKKVKGKGRRISGKDLPLRAKLTREHLEEQLEKEVMMKFAPQAHSLTCDQRQKHSESEFPNRKTSSTNISKVKVDKNSNSLQSIASDVLLESCLSDQKNNGEMEKSTSDVQNSLDHQYHKNINKTSEDISDSDDDCKSSESESGSLVSAALKNDIPFNSNPEYIKATTKRRKKTYCPAKIETGWAPKNRTCTSCGETNHLVYDCPNKIGILF